MVHLVNIFYLLLPTPSSANRQCKYYPVYGVAHATFEIDCNVWKTLIFHIMA